MKKVFVAFSFCLLTLFVQGQSAILCKWKSMDDNSGKPRSIVELAERNGKVYGKVIRIFNKPGEDPDPVCDKCSKDDSRYNKKVIGMEIITEMVKDHNEYVRGYILDPEVGRVYRCKIWLEDNTLKVRGYFGPFYHTQTWQKAQ